MSKMLNIIAWHQTLCKLCCHQRYMHNNRFAAARLFFGWCLMCLHHDCSGLVDGQSRYFKHPMKEL